MAILHFIAVKKSLVDHMLAQSDRASVNELPSPSSDSPTCGVRARMGDEGKAVGFPRLTALLSVNRLS